ncbi:hypothetical protein C8R43DRAFT_1229093 [Mycena crocata]|nr:hypothetical protein C8R43DRAFT_1229093 [Mycena crocata]
MRLQALLVAFATVVAVSAHAEHLPRAQQVKAGAPTWKRANADAPGWKREDKMKRADSRAARQVREFHSLLLSRQYSTCPLRFSWPVLCLRSLILLHGKGSTACCFCSLIGYWGRCRKLYQQLSVN